MTKNPLMSVITPVYSKSNEFVNDLYTSLKEQEFEEWEWVVLLNNGGKLNQEILSDNRVRVIHEDIKGIGALKKKLSELSKSEFIVEVDSDDMLTKDALKEIYDSFKDKNTQFIYSNSAEFFDKTWQNNTYGPYWGWTTKPFKWKNKDLLETISFIPTASSIWRIEWAPNHVRAWRKKSYFKIGGHDVTLPSGDDHDLICRFYLEYGPSSFKWINKCLYLYRRHEHNYSVTDNSEVQEVVLNNYFKYSRDIAVKWTKDNDFSLIDFGGKGDVWKDFKKINTIDELKKIKTNSVGTLKCHKFLQYFNNPIEILEECWRVLAHGGVFFLEVPSTECNHAFANPLHKSFWNRESAKFYTEKRYADEINFKGKFQCWRNETFYINDDDRNKGILTTQIDLVAIKKDSPILPGPQWWLI